MFNILVVDDESLTREYLKNIIPLINVKWQVAFEATDGCEALEVLEEHEVDLVITDIKMPVMDGLELCRNMAEQFPNRKVIILSGHDEFTLAKEAILYGVNEYLLKPIVKEELRTALDRATLDIEKERNQELALRTMRSLSEDSKNHVVKNFLKAVISDSNAEIKVLYPLLFRLKVSLIESEGMILILALDEDVIMGKMIPLADIPVFQFILNQVATEIVENESLGRVFYDGVENTIVLITGDSDAEMFLRCTNIYNKVAEVIHNSTSITITGAAGSCVSDVLQLNLSYNSASKLLQNRLLYGGNSIYSNFNEKQNQQYNANKSIQELDKVISVIKSGLLDHNEMTYLSTVKSYIDLFSSHTILDIFRYGIYMIRSFAALSRDVPVEGIGAALNQLKKWGSSLLNEPSKEEINAAFKEILKSFARYTSPEPTHYNEHNLVEKAKEYIYNHYSEPISLALIAEVIGVSPSYLSNIFHSKVSESYIKFLTRVRMEQAAKLLRARPAEKVFDVSEKVGYVSVKHFSHVFKQHFHMPPGEYQENYIQ